MSSLVLQEAYEKFGRGDELHIYVCNYSIDRRGLVSYQESNTTLAKGIRDCFMEKHLRTSLLDS